MFLLFLSLPKPADASGPTETYNHEAAFVALVAQKMEHLWSISATNHLPLGWTTTLPGVDFVWTSIVRWSRSIQTMPRLGERTVSLSSSTRWSWWGKIRVTCGTSATQIPLCDWWQDTWLSSGRLDCFVDIRLPSVDDAVRINGGLCLTWIVPRFGFPKSRERTQPDRVVHHTTHSVNNGKTVGCGWRIWIDWTLIQTDDDRGGTACFWERNRATTSILDRTDGIRSFENDLRFVVFQSSQIRDPFLPPRSTHDDPNAYIERTTSFSAFHRHTTFAWKACCAEVEESMSRYRTTEPSGNAATRFRLSRNMWQFGAIAAAMSLVGLQLLILFNTYGPGWCPVLWLWLPWFGLSLISSWYRLSCGIPRNDTATTSSLLQLNWSGTYERTNVHTGRRRSRRLSFRPRKSDATTVSHSQRHSRFSVVPISSNEPELSHTMQVGGAVNCNDSHGQGLHDIRSGAWIRDPLCDRWSSWSIMFLALPLHRCRSPSRRCHGSLRAGSIHVGFWAVSTAVQWDSSMFFVSDSSLCSSLISFTSSRAWSFVRCGGAPKKERISWRGQWCPLSTSLVLLESLVPILSRSSVFPDFCFILCLRENDVTLQLVGCECIA